MLRRKEKRSRPVEDQEDAVTKRPKSSVSLLESEKCMERLVFGDGSGVIGALSAAAGRAQPPVRLYLRGLTLGLHYVYTSLLIFHACSFTQAAISVRDLYLTQQVSHSQGVFVVVIISPGRTRILLLAYHKSP